MEEAEIIADVKLSKDLKLAAEKLQEKEVRFLVDAYYTMQRNRIRSGNQVTALAKSAEAERYVRDRELASLKNHEGLIAFNKTVEELCTSHLNENLVRFEAAYQSLCETYNLVHRVEYDDHDYRLVIEVLDETKLHEEARKQIEEKIKCLK